ncbi:MAG: transporter [Candidatus Omnitrophota bacterium]
MRRAWFKMGLVVGLLFLLAVVSEGAHPLITDDAGTAGKGKVQIEVNAETGYEKEEEVKGETWELAGSFTLGVSEQVDLVLGIPYSSCKVKEDDVVTSDENGVGDFSLECKWRFLEGHDWSLACKPGLTFPAGDEEKGLGTGRSTYGLVLIATKEIQSCAVHCNAGYIRNENKAGEREDIWHLSLAGEVEMNKNLKMVANIGVEENTEKGADQDPVFFLGGLIYNLSERTNLDLGVKTGLNKAETDISYLAGVTFFF